MAQHATTPNSVPLTSSNGSELIREQKAEQRFSARAIVLALTWLAVTVVGVFVLLQLFVRQRLPELGESQFTSAQSRWEENDPSSYDMDIKIGGIRAGTVHVEVRNGEVVAETRDGRAPKKHSWEYWSVPGLFEQLERELEIAEDPEHEMQAEANTRIELRCEFDAEYGYPRQFQRIVYGGGTPAAWQVTAFEAR